MMRPATKPHALHARANGSSTAATHTLLMPPPAAEHHVDAAGQGAELGWDALPRFAPHHNRVLHHGAAQAGEGTCSETTAALFSPQVWQAGAARASCQRQGACCQASRRPTHLLGGVGCAAGQLLEVLHVARQAPWQAAACTPRCPSRLGLSKGSASARQGNSGFVTSTVGMQRQAGRSAHPCRCPSSWWRPPRSGRCALPATSCLRCQPSLWFPPCSTAGGQE